MRDSAARDSQDKKKTYRLQHSLKVSIAVLMGVMGTPRLGTQTGGISKRRQTDGRTNERNKSLRGNTIILGFIGSSDKKLFLLPPTLKFPLLTSEGMSLPLGNS